MASARARGGLPKALFSTIAALVEMSPWAGSRGGSAVTRDRSGGAVMPCSAATAATALADRLQKLGKQVHVDY